MLHIKQEELKAAYNEGYTVILADDGDYEIVYSTSQKKFILQKISNSTK